MWALVHRLTRKRIGPTLSTSDTHQQAMMLNEAKTSRPRPISGGWGRGQK